jgi:hypothetical protein
MASPSLDDVDRLLRQTARRAVERLATRLEPVHPDELAMSVVYAHFNLLPVRARRDELIVGIAGYIRQLRAINDVLEGH